MIKYSIMSRSGKIGVDWLCYEEALQLYYTMKELWSHTNLNFERIAWTDSKGKNGYITDEVFLNDCVPKEHYQMWYEGTAKCIVDDYEIIKQEMADVLENGNLEEFHYEKMMMSDFERDLLPEFEGF